MHYPVKVWATASPCQPPLPLTAHSSTPITAGCTAAARPQLARSMRQVGVERFLCIHPRCPEAGLPQLKPGGEQEPSTLAVAVLSAVLKKGSPGGGTGV